MRPRDGDVTSIRPSVATGSQTTSHGNELIVQLQYPHSVCKDHVDSRNGVLHAAFDELRASDEEAEASNIGL